MTTQAISEIANAKDKHLLSGYLRERDLVKRARPLFTSDSVPQILAACPKEPLDRLDKFLLNISRMSGNVADVVHVEPAADYPLGYCKGQAEFGMLIKFLREDKLLRENEPNNALVISPAGWRRVKEIKESDRSESIQAFVAMSFSKDRKYIYDDAIAPAIKESGYTPYRIDADDSLTKIDNEIIAQIRRSRFVVADFTGQRQAVYFETGFAQGLNIP
ncbi:MAG: hypothetical protein IIB00_03045, partial [candidate division Zixibacteria bacterium]|nr:hypothetical protein [candidate division Zixibacteria bacterium]